MPVHLLDVNVLIALAWPQHVHHDLVHRWFAAHAIGGWATCPITQCGFVRISSNPRIMGAAATPEQAVSALRLLMAHADHEFWPDDLSFADQQWIRHQALIGHRQVTDAYLLGLTAMHAAKLATLDQGIIVGLAAGHADAVVVIR